MLNYMLPLVRLPFRAYSRGIVMVGVAVLYSALFQLGAAGGRSEAAASLASSAPRTVMQVSREGRILSSGQRT